MLRENISSRYWLNVFFYYYFLRLSFWFFGRSLERYTRPDLYGPNNAWKKKSLLEHCEHSFECIFFYLLVNQICCKSCSFFLLGELKIGNCKEKQIFLFGTCLVDTSPGEICVSLCPMVRDTKYIISGQKISAAIKIWMERKICSHNVATRYKNEKIIVSRKVKIQSPDTHTHTLIM